MTKRKLNSLLFENTQRIRMDDKEQIWIIFRSCERERRTKSRAPLLVLIFYGKKEIIWHRKLVQLGLDIV